MNLPNQFSRPRRIPDYMQPTELFHFRNVSEECKSREQRIEQRIGEISHSEILSLDRETVFTQLVNTYLPDESTHYATLAMDKAELQRNSNQATVTALYKIPYTGSKGFFEFKTENEYNPASNEVTIHLDQFDKEVTFYYELPLDDSAKSLEKRLQTLLKNDVAWVVDSLDDVIRHFQDHDARLMSIIGKALEERIAAVSNIEGLMERIVIPEEIFEDKRSVMRDPSLSRERHPRYDVFKPLLFGLQKGQCNGTKLEILYSKSTVDHIIPQAAGGGDELGNLQVLCAPCNGLKKDGAQDAYLSEIDKDPSICLGRPVTDHP